MSERGVEPVPSQSFLMPIVQVIALAAAVYLILTGPAKFMSHESFEFVLASHELLPKWLVPAFSILVPSIEVLLGATTAYVTLAHVFSPRMVLVALGCLALSFAVYTGILCIFPPPKPVPCGCGILSGHQPVSDWIPLTARNMCVATLFFGLGWRVRKW
jgi:hypothetical protein